MNKWFITVNGKEHMVVFLDNLKGKKAIQVDTETVLTLSYKPSILAPLIVPFFVDGEMYELCCHCGMASLIHDGIFVDTGLPYPKCIRDRFSVIGFLLALSTLVCFWLIPPGNPLMIIFTIVGCFVLFVTSLSPFHVRRPAKILREVIFACCFWGIFLAWYFYFF